MKLLLSTSNIITSAASSIRRDPTTKSNTEFVESLRANFAEHSASVTPSNGSSNGAAKETPASSSYRTWTKQNDTTLEIPTLNLAESALIEERENVDLTAKLFYLPGASKGSRAEQTREAVELVLKALNTDSIDLLIVSFPGIYFDEEEDCPDKLSTRGPVEADPEPLEGQLKAWEVLEALHSEGTVRRIGLAEFGKERLEKLLDQVKIKPSVDQINLRDCCSVPKDLMALAKSRGVELLVHNDCSNILPRGTLRGLLGSAGVLAESSKTGDKRKREAEEGAGAEAVANGNAESGLTGEVQPQWVIKYTAVVKNRGVVESKGYFAVAELEE